MKNKESISNELDSEDKSGLVLGILLARNEWPLLGMCISHALTNHVDELLVIDHASTDETELGLKVLQSKWGSKLQIVKLAKGPLHHQALNLVTLEIIDRDRYSWVYHVDADEFLIVAEGKSLKALLTEMPIDVDIVRYPLFNYVAPRDFQESNFEQYKELTFRAKTDDKLTLDFEEMINAIMNFKASFFDIPFPSKVIYRTSVDSWPIAGCHALVGKSENDEFVLTEDLVFAAHLPFLTRDRLIRRADHGKEIREAGYSRDFAWQSQLVDEMRSLGQLDNFWASHSIDRKNWETENLLPQAVRDERLVDTLVSTISTFKENLTTYETQEKDLIDSSRESIGLASGVNAVQRMAEKKDSSMALVASENSTLRSEKHELEQELLESLVKFERLQKSISWRITKPLRSIHKKIVKS
jgi:hypothetical protein